jgi:Holliday junction resolvase RusA-like endonuclease
MVSFWVPGVPVAQPRVKATRRGVHAGVYTPTKTSTGRSNGAAEWKATVRLAASQACSGEFLGPLGGPLRVDLEFVFPRQSHMTWKSRPMPRYWKVTKPDRDNLDKAVMDALKGVVWVDDNQVCAGSIEKWHAAGGESPGVRVTITELGLESGSKN